MCLSTKTTHMITTLFGIEVIQYPIFFSKCPFSRTNLIQCQRQPGRDGEAVPAVQLQHAALSDARAWRAGEDDFSRRPIRCRPRPQKQIGAIPALRGWQPAQLLLSWCERTLILVCLCVCLAADKLVIYSDPPPQSQSTPPECLVRCFSLLTGVLAGYVSTGFLTEEEACCSQLFTKAKVSDASQCIKMWMYGRFIISSFGDHTSQPLKY